ncbi:hypothetical protein ACIQGZ_17325 [Streptomyces sp. NPDC092296]|uniref:hypothetical protein n=1 Tax=Streptomyces sp. NPDC092296 TaxID=3366012 RepID=UPI0038130DF2
MRPLTGTDILDFYATRADLLVLTADGEYTHLDTADITSSSYESAEPVAYDYATTEDGDEVQILLARTTITDGDWFPDALDEDGNLDSDAAQEMADIITADGILPSRVLKAQDATKKWEAAAAAANELALDRARAVAAVAAYAGNQSEAGRLLNLDQAAVNRLVRKVRTARAKTEAAA